MQWWNVWTKFWQAVENFADALDGATVKLRKHCDLDAPLEIEANGKAHKRVLTTK